MQGVGHQSTLRFLPVCHTVVEKRKLDFEARERELSLSLSLSLFLCVCVCVCVCVWLREMGHWALGEITRDVLFVGHK